jgi:ketosteroid isomerase-like protein
MKTLYLSAVLVIGLFTPFSGVAQFSYKKAFVDSNKRITVQFLQSFADAFNAHDINKIMSFMTQDCVFEASAGEYADGEKFMGQENVRKAFENVFSTFHDAHWANARHFISENRGFSEWTFTGSKSDGSTVEVTGCDLFTFKDGKIAVKNSYRKSRLSGTLK